MLSSREGTPRILCTPSWQAVDMYSGLGLSLDEVDTCRQSNGACHNQLDSHRTCTWISQIPAGRPDPTALWLLEQPESC